MSAGDVWLRIGAPKGEVAVIVSPHTADALFDAIKGEMGVEIHPRKNAVYADDHETVTGWKGEPLRSSRRLSPTPAPRVEEGQGYWLADVLAKNEARYDALPRSIKDDQFTSAPESAPAGVTPDAGIIEATDRELTDLLNIGFRNVDTPWMDNDNMAEVRACLTKIIRDRVAPWEAAFKLRLSDTQRPEGIRIDVDTKMTVVDHGGYYSKDGKIVEWIATTGKDVFTPEKTDG